MGLSLKLDTFRETGILEGIEKRYRVRLSVGISLLLLIINFFFFLLSWKNTVPSHLCFSKSVTRFYVKPDLACVSDQEQVDFMSQPE